MISQLGVPCPGTTIDPRPVSAPLTGTGSQWGGLGIAIHSGVIPFLQSLHPGYLPPRLQPLAQRAEAPDFAIGPAHGQGSGFLQGIELAARVVSAYAALPAEVGSLLGSFISLSAVGRFAREQLGGLVTPASPIPRPGQENHSVGGSSAKDKRKAKKAQETSQQQISHAVLTNKTASRVKTVSAPALATMALMSMDRLTGAAAVTPSGEPGAPDNPISVGDSDTLVKIGQPGYPRDAYYRQSASFYHNSSESIGTKDAAFTGHYDGGCHTISGPVRCLFHKLGRNALIRNLRVANVNINNSDVLSAAVACEMATKSAVRDVRVEDASIINRRACSAGGSCYSGVITGRQQRGSLIKAVEVHNSSVTTLGEGGVAGIGAGNMGGKIVGLTVTDSELKTFGERAHAGIGGGDINGDIQSLTVSGSRVRTDGGGAFAGLGGGKVHGEIKDLTVTESRITTTGEYAHAGIGGGVVGASYFGEVYQDGSINNLVAINSQVRTEAYPAYAAVGGGYVEDEVRETTAINCSVSVGDKRGYAGIGAGYNSLGKVLSTRAVGCNVTSMGNDRAADIGAGSHPSQPDYGTVEDTRSLNSRVNGALRNIGDLTIQSLCSKADLRLVTRDCQVNREPLITDHWNCSSKPFIPERGSFWDPIPVNDSQTFNRIGQTSDYPPDAHYYQTDDMDGADLNSRENMIFSGHYDGRDHTISHQKMCLFRQFEGIVENLQLVNARIASESQHAGVVACTTGKASHISNIRVANSSVTIRGPSMAAGGIITGFQLRRQERIENIEVDSCTVVTEGSHQKAGIIAGVIRGVADQLTVKNSRVKTGGDSAVAGIGGGEVDVAGRVSHLTSVCNKLETVGSFSSAGIGAGRVYGDLGHITAINSSVITRGSEAYVGVGSGEAGSTTEIGNLHVVHCRAMATGYKADSGIGVGFIQFSGTKTTLHDITSVNSQSMASGQQSHAGIAAGYTPEHAAITDIRTVNTQVNGRTFSDANVNITTLCASADPRFVGPDCRVSPAISGKCPLPPMPETTAQPVTVITMAQPVTGITMPFPGLPTNLLSSTSAVGLSAGGITGIAAGAAVCVALAGFGRWCIYRYYHRAEESNQQWLTLEDISVDPDLP